MPAPVPPPPAVDAALFLRRALLRAADALLPAGAVMWDKTMGIERTMVIAALADLGVADELAAGAATAAELAPRVGADADTLHRVLRAAAVDGVVRLDRRGRFKLTRLGRTLKSDAYATLRPWARYMGLASTRAAWGDLTESVRSGRAAFPRVNGQSVWAHFAEHPEEERLFAGAMRSVTEIDAPAVAAVPLWPESGTVCDVAGGAGTLLAAILKAHPGLRGVLVEAPGVLKEAETYLAGEGVRDRVELVEGNIFEELRVAADVYVLKTVLHDWDDPTSAKILANVRPAMAPGTRMILIEQVQERNTPAPFASLADLQMLTQCDDGRERSRDELRALLTAARLTPGRVERAAVNALIEATA
ncbi:MAG TPA: methyltransferase [Solirubrobacteraceae bacterium]|jgi:hypothetical protein